MLKKLEYPLWIQSQFFTKLQNFGLQILKRIGHSFRFKIVTDKTICLYLVYCFRILKTKTTSTIKRLNQLKKLRFFVWFATCRNRSFIISAPSYFTLLLRLFLYIRYIEIYKKFLPL